LHPVGVTQTRDEGGVEVGQCAGADDDHVAQDEADGAPVADGEAEGLALANALFAQAARLDTAFAEAGNSDGALAFGEAGAGGGEVEEDERGDASPDDCCDAFDDEEPGFLLAFV
jgi:hypothetical protein